MATSKTADGTGSNSSNTTLVEISKLKEAKKTPESVFRGICAAEGWRPGKSVSGTEYDAAIQRFLRRPVGKAGH